MPTDRDDEETNETSENDSDDERDEADESDEESEESSAAPARAASRDITQPVPEGFSEPLNRAERRAQRKQLRRSGNKAALADDVDPGAPGRKPPPRTVSGKTSSDELPAWAKSSADWLNRHKNTLVMGVVVALLAVGGTIGWRWRQERRDAGAAARYREAVEIAAGRIRAADAAPEPPNAPPQRGPTFPDIAARNRAALAAFRRVSNEFPNAPVTPLARLSEGTTLYGMGRYAEARRVLEGLIGTDLGPQEARLREALGFTLEALNQNDRAIQQFQELGRAQDGAWRDLGQFHQARILAHTNQTARARDILHAMIERMNRARPDDPTGPSSRQGLYSEAQTLLREVAPDDPLARRATAGNDESIQQLIEQLRQGRRPPGTLGGPRPGGGAGGGGGGGGGGGH